MINERQYYEKYNVTFDPTPSAFKKPINDEEIQKFIADIQRANPGKPIMMLSLLKQVPLQTESPVTEATEHQRQETSSLVDTLQSEELTIEEIKEKCRAFLGYLREDYPPPGPHVLQGTELQHESDFWHSERGFKVTFMLHDYQGFCIKKVYYEREEKFLEIACLGNQTKTKRHSSTSSRLRTAE